MDLRGRRLLFLGTTPRASMRRYFPETSRRLGVRSILVADRIDDESAALFDEVHQVDLLCRERVVELITGLDARERIDGVMTSIEHCVELCACVGRLLSLPALSPESALRCRSKYEMRRSLAAAGLPVPRFTPVASAAEMAVAVERIGAPCVLKPVDGWASFGVVRLAGTEDLDAVFASARAAVEGETGHVPSFLVESYAEGPEFSVEGVVDATAIHVAGITAKKVTPWPYFEELQHVFPAGLASGERALVEDVARRAVAALGIEVGGFHAELRLTEEGPVVMEVGARLGGDGIPAVVRLASGIDLVAGAIGAALGSPIDLTPSRERVAGIRFFVPPREGRLREVRLDLDLRRLAGVADFYLDARPDDVLRLPPNAYGTRLGWIVAVHRERERVLATLEAAERALRWEFEP